MNSFLVPRLIPLQDEQGRPFPRPHHDALTHQLADHELVIRALRIERR